ncbi:MAG: oxidoreductase domain-containing protein, partial [Parcubacteria group bacterium Greene0416_79]
MGARWAEVISHLSRVSLSVVADARVSRAKVLADTYGVSYSRQVKDIFKSDLDVVIIATPHAFLFPLAKEALLAGKHVFVEKPGSRTPEEMRELCRLALKMKRTLAVGFNYRFFDSIRRAKQIIDEGGIGSVHALRIVHGHPGRPGYEKEWRMNKKLSGGGVLMDQGLHVIDLARFFFGSRTTKVCGYISNRAWHAPVEDYASVVLETARGQVASLSVSISEWKPVFTCEIFGERGFIALGGLGRRYGDGE